MIELRVLGALDLRGPGGQEILSVLSQPKRVALLAYLALATPRGFHRRDKLLALFWPELDESHARNSLSQALRFLRRSLGDEAILTRGGEEVGLDFDLITVDALDFRSALDAASEGADEARAQSRLEEALDLYRGHLMEGFFLSGCPEFESWLESERQMLREAAAGVAWALAHHRIATGSLTEAERMGQRALGLVATDENEVRRFIEALAGAGDRAAAVRFYEVFAQRLAVELELRPGRRTRELIERIRTPEQDQVSTRGDPLLRRLERRSVSGPGVGRSIDPAVGKPVRTTGPHSRSWRSSMRRPILVGFAAVAVGLVAYHLLGQIRSSTRPETSASGEWATEHRVAVLPPQNQTGDPSLDPIGSWAADYVAGGLARAGLVRHVISVEEMAAVTAASSEDGDPSDLVLTWPEETGADLAVLGGFFSTGDSLEFRLKAVDREGVLVANIDPVRSPLDDPSETLSRLQMRVLGALAGALAPGHDYAWSIQERHPPKPEALQALLEGVTVANAGAFRESIPHLERAARLDSAYLEPLRWLVVEYWNTGRYVKSDSLCQIIERRAEELSQEQWLDTSQMCAWNRLDQWAALGFARRLAEFSPLYWYDVGWMATSLNRPREAVDAFSRYDPDLGRRAREWAPISWLMWARALHMLGEHGRELEVARDGLQFAREIGARDPSYRNLLAAEIFALIALGRFDEADERLGNWWLNLAPGQNPRPVLHQVAMEFDAHGHPERAREVRAQLLDWFSARPVSERTLPDNLWWEAFLLLTLDRNGEAELLLEPFARDTADFHPGITMLLGITAARRGDRVEAERRSEVLRIEAENRRFGKWPLTWRRPHILATLGDLDEAVRLLEQAFEEGWFIWSAHPHREPFLKPLWDHPAFLEFVRPKG
jgi:serine/threonine-protein kinase